MLKRLFAMLLAVLMLFALAPLAAAEETPAADHYIEINAQTFPDEAFRDFIRNHYGQRDPDSDADFEHSTWYLTEETVLSVTEMDIGDCVSDFTGLGYFTELTKLIVDPYGTTAVNLNFSKNTKLRRLELQNFTVDAIDLSPLTELTYLYVKNVSLQSLDLSHNTKLMDLVLENVPLTALDISGYADLHLLSLTDVPITALDVTNCKLLKGLEIMGCPITALDVTSCAYLRDLALFYLPITELDLTNCTKLETLQVESCPIAALDLFNCEKLIRAFYDNCFDDETAMLYSLNLGSKPALVDLYFNSTNLTEIDLSQCPNLASIEVVDGRLTELDLSQCPNMRGVHCNGNQLTSLILNASAPLSGVWCGKNHLTELDLSAYTGLRYCEPGTQTVTAVGGFTPSGDAYTFDMHALVSDTSRVSFSDAAFSYDPASGVVTAQEAVESFAYLYNTGNAPMRVEVSLAPEYDGEATAAFREGAVQYKGETPYVIANGSAQKPAVIVTDANGNEVDPAYYTVTYAYNVDPGTGTATIAFNGTDQTLSLWFKIYLPATEWTKVENVKDGILIQWKPVEGAAGYVIYRRAWSTTTNGWTQFKRWWNVTGTSWIDGSDQNHKVYAGTRYQYGVKAYFARRFDPVAGGEIGGNVNDPSGNYNLGLVGPLKTTVRITSRVLNSVTAGSKQMTIKWMPTKYFTGIRVQYAEDANFTKNCKDYKIAFKLDENGSAVSPVPSEDVITGLTSGKTYYVRICSYHLFDGTTYYGEWSNVLSAKIG